MNRYQVLSALLAGTLFAGMAGLALPASPADDTEKAESEDAVDWNKEREFWSFRQPIARPQPVVKNKRWPNQPLDYFVLARLEQPANLGRHAQCLKEIRRGRDAADAERLSRRDRQRHPVNAGRGEGVSRVLCRR